MSVTLDEVKKVSHLARINVDAEKTGELYGRLNKILEFIEHLYEVDCSKIDKNMQYVSSLHEREDVVEICDPAVLDNAPLKENNMFVLPKVIG